MSNDIQASNFVKRQTRTSDYSYFMGSWEDLEALARLHFNQQRKGYRDEVILVTVPPEGFFSSVVPITDDVEFDRVFEARVEGEPKFLKTVTYGIKTPASHVDLVLYHHDLLEDDSDATGSEWEIVSINARHTDTPYPMAPTTIARNILSGTDHPFGKGGTPDENTTALELAEAIAFWQTHTTIRER
jgi:hypothetical protein